MLTSTIVKKGVGRSHIYKIAIQGKRKHLFYLFACIFTWRKLKKHIPELSACTCNCISNLKISNLYFNTVKNSSGSLLHIKYNYITIFNNNKYISKESLKNTTQNYTKQFGSMPVLEEAMTS